VRSLGADDVIDYTAQDFTDGGPVHDVIVDVLGKAGFPRSLPALKPGGRYLLVGFSGGLWGIARALVTGGVVHLRGRARFVTGAADPKQADLVFLQELIDAGKLRTAIGRRYGLDEIAEAHRYADTGHKIGNVAGTDRRSDRVSSGRSGAHSSRRAQLTLASVVAQAVVAGLANASAMVAACYIRPSPGATRITFAT
jgi:NADPH2:quinone reductase